MRRRGWLLLVLLFAATALAPRLATALPPDDADKEKAFQLVKLGLDMVKKGKHELAVDAFGEAWSLFKHPKILFYKGRSLMALERWEASLAVFQLIQDDPDLKAEQQNEVAASIAMAESRLRATSVEIRTLRGDGAPLQGANLLVDGDKVGRSPMVIDLRRGDYRVMALMEGYKPTEIVLNVRTEESKSVSLVLEASGAVMSPTVEDRSELTPSDAGVQQDAGEPWRGNDLYAWSALGGGAGLATLGVGLFTYYGIFKASNSVAKNQEIQGETAILATAGILTALGAGGVGASFFLWEKDDSAAALLPTLNGFVLSGTF
jgi:hypothetical protein